ncbi:GNAT family N-acetyltransferase [Anaerosacchariphilus polymeriproducens]|uniref:N-acetyltransferase n=1 Tax=Anaerosacchariphilus polymeriproducens TaxID=1812858 RepID=A0A371AUL0_9FIRM|nr:GNAT family protein [Anaerosacchariphilus polymeriproducens]RDU23229.1 N-acetyltransferase [Anaerosacchariphilus polymeriproducens]
MKFKSISIIDKLGRNVILRNAEVSDADDLIKYLKITTSETPFLTRESDEVVLTHEQEEHFIKRSINAERELILVATIDGKHIGNCSLMGIGSYKRYAHRGDISIALYKEFCGIGIGKKMMLKVLELAKEIGYEQVELEVITDNKAAITLYKQLGFEKYGSFPHNVKYANGKYADADWMMKKL